MKPCTQSIRYALFYYTALFCIEKKYVYLLWFAMQGQGTDRKNNKRSGTLGVNKLRNHTDTTYSNESHELIDVCALQIIIRTSYVHNVSIC